MQNWQFCKEFEEYGEVFVDVVVLRLLPNFLVFVVVVLVDFRDGESVLTECDFGVVTEDDVGGENLMAVNSLLHDDLVVLPGVPLAGLDSRDVEEAREELGLFGL